MLIIIPSAYATPMSKEDRDGYINSSFKSCLSDEFKAYMGKHYKESDLIKYCRCSAERSADNITSEMLQQYVQTKNQSIFIPAIESSGNYCFDHILENK